MESTLTFASAKTRNAEFGANVGALINTYCERVISEGKWKGTTDSLSLNVFRSTDEDGAEYGYVTLPRRFGTALGVRFKGATGWKSTSRMIHNQWFDWQPGRDCYWKPSSGLIDAGGGYAGFQDWSVDSYLRVKTDYAETGNLLIRGIGTNEESIFTGSPPSVIEGVNLSLTATSTTTMLFRANSRIQVNKPATNGYVRLYSVTPGGVETLVGLYEPGETVPSYRRYMVPKDLTADSTVEVMAKIRHVDMVSDNDLVIPGNASAVKNGLNAINYEERHDQEKAQAYWARVYSILNGDLHAHHGDGPASVALFGFDRFYIPQIQ